METTRQKIAVVDIDGTVADCTHRLHVLGGSEAKPRSGVDDHSKKPTDDQWKLFYRLLHYDTPMKDHIQFIKRYVKENDMKVVFVTGRNSKTMEDTRDFVRKYMKFAVNEDRLCNLAMRSESDRRPAWEVKKDLLQILLGRFAVEAVFEDNADCLRMYAEELKHFPCTIFHAADTTDVLQPFYEYAVRGRKIYRPNV